MIQACDPLDITLFGIQSLYQCCCRTIKPQGLHALGGGGAFMVKLLICFLGIRDLAMNLSSSRNDLVWAESWN